MVSGFNHMHIDALDFDANDFEVYYHPLSPKEREAYYSCIANSKVLYLTISSIVDSVVIAEVSIMMNSIKYSANSIYAGELPASVGSIIYTIVDTGSEGPVLMIEKVVG